MPTIDSHLTAYFVSAAICLFVLLAVWWGLDRIEDANQQKRERLARDVRTRQRMGAVIAISDRRRP